MDKHEILFDFTKKHLVGKFIYAGAVCGQLTEIIFPEANDVFTLTAKDLKVKKLKVLNDTIDIFADKEVEYPGQPVAAAFCNNRETLDLFISATKLVVKETETTIQQTGKPFQVKSGNIEQYFTQDAKVYTSEMEIKEHVVSQINMQQIMADYISGNVYIQVATQWPIHLRDSVASTLLCSKKQVKIYSQPYSINHDELLIKPSVSASIAAIAAKETESSVEFLVPCYSVQPKIKFKFFTQMDENAKPLAHKVEVEADLGAYPLFASELSMHLMAGLIPMYKVNALQIQVKTIKTNKAPANFFGDLGYSIAFAASEQHFNFLLHKTGQMPSDWRLENLKDFNSVREGVRRSSESLSLTSILPECINDSMFNRTHSVYSQVNVKNKLGRAIMSYSRGVGLSCGQGIMGFESKFPYIAQYSAGINQYNEDNAEISISTAVNKTATAIYKSVVGKALGIPESNISFADINKDSVKDTGPDVLSRDICIIPKMLENTCTLINDKRKRSVPFPILEEGFYFSHKDTPFFTSNCSGVMIINLHIDTVQIIPVIDSITARIKSGKVYDTATITDSVRHVISTTISEICPCAQNKSTLDLKVRSNPKLEPSSCVTLIRGLTISAFMTAISQALSCNIQELPVTEENLIAIVKKQGELHEVELHD